MLGEEVAQAAAGDAPRRRPSASGSSSQPTAATALEVRELQRRRDAHGRLLRAAAGRDPRHRGARGPGPGRALRRALRTADARRRARSSSQGEPLRARHPYDAIRAGVVLVPADRLHALLPQRSIAREHRRAALQQPAPLGADQHARRSAGACARRSTRCTIDTRAAAPGAPALRRQPAEGDDRALARGRLPDAALLRPDARHRRRHEAPDLRAPARLADDGAAVLLFTSELAEFPLVCDRVVCLYGGRVTAELAAAGADEATLLRAMHGLERGGGSVSTATAAAPRAAGVHWGRLARRHGWTVGVYVLLRRPHPLLADDPGRSGGRSTSSRSRSTRCRSRSPRWRRRS